MRQQGNDTLIVDLRMGEEPDYTFTFNLGSAAAPAAAPQREDSLRPSLAQAWHKFTERL